MIQVKNNEELQSIFDMNKDWKYIIDFYADWCSPCKMLNPVLQQFYDLNTDYTIIKVNVEEAKELASEYSITSLPTLYILKWVESEVVKWLIDLDKLKQLTWVN